MCKSVIRCFLAVIILSSVMTSCTPSESASITDIETTPSTVSSVSVLEAKEGTATAISENTVTETIFFSDSFDYDNDGDEESIYFIEEGLDNDGDLIFSSWYSSGDASKKMEEIKVTSIVGNDKASSFSTFNTGSQHFVCVTTGIAMGLGVPIVCFTIIADNPIIVGDEFLKMTESGTYNTLFVVVGGIPFVRECGPGAGVNNLYPLYWDSREFKLYRTVESDMEYVYEADVNHIVTGIGTVKNVLIRSNGLLHINYYNDNGEVNSKTYCLENDKITDEYDSDLNYDKGVYREVMEVLSKEEIES